MRLIDADELKKDLTRFYDNEVTAKQLIDEQPTIMQEPKKCKDCKWWKDSDGVYRRGVFTVSPCPLNTKKVFEGDGYCYLFEPRESEENKK
mgnify:CR=1 FL=1